MSMFECAHCGYGTSWLFTICYHLKKCKPIPSEFSCENDMEIYKCETCSFQTVLKVNYRNHKNLKCCYGRSNEVCEEIKDETDEAFECGQCNFSTFSKYLYKIHQLKVYNDHSSCKTINTKRQFPCDKCLYVATRKTCLRRHTYAKHTDPTKIKWFKCAQCPFKAKFKYYLSSHILRKHTEGNKRISCDQCSCVVKTALILKRHKYRKHTDLTNSPWFYCSVCPYKSKFKYDLNLHINRTHSETEEFKYSVKFPAHTKPNKQFSCEQCSYVSPRRSALKSHILAKHTDSTEVVWFKCAHCPYKTKWKHDLNHHVSKFHAENSKRFSCDQCAYVTTLKPALTQHIHSEHTSTNPHKCNYCPFTFKKKHTLKCHIISKHLDPSKINWLTCEICSFKTKLNSTLNRHLKRIHQLDNKVFTSKETSNKCDHCPFVAKRKYDLRFHVINKHLDPAEINWFTCEICFFKTKLKCILDRHVKRVHKLDNKVEINHL